ncbi:MAG: hypothetical protein WD042_16665 [Phycisphaeraceae bacterium]
MIRTDDIRSLTEFRQHARKHLDRLAKSRGVEVLTVNGQARGVVMAPQTFDELAEKAMQAEITARIKCGMSDVAAGRVRDSYQARQLIADKHGLKLKP